MKVANAIVRLKELLAKNGFDESNLTPIPAWQAYKHFSEEPVSCADDGFLFQIGCYDFSGEKLCYLDFVRQFTVEDEDGEYDHMEQLHIEFTRRPDSKLEGLKTNLWAYEFDHLSEFFSAAENLDAFKMAASYPDWNCKIYQEEI